MLGHTFQDFPLNTINKREIEFSLFSLATVKHKINSVSPSLELHKSIRLRFQEPVCGPQLKSSHCYLKSHSHSCLSYLLAWLYLLAVLLTILEQSL